MGRRVQTNIYSVVQMPQMQIQGKPKLDKRTLNPSFF